MGRIDWQNRFLAFRDDKLIADGNQLEVALKLKAEGAEPALRRGEILLFAGSDGRQIDLHLSGSELDIERRYGAPPQLESASAIVDSAEAASTEKNLGADPS